MDNVLVDFQSGIDKLDEKTKQKYEPNLDDAPGIFALMKPITGAIDSFNLLSKYFSVYILSTAPWKNDSAWSDKVSWVKKYLPLVAHKRLIITHHKDLNKGDYLIDDRILHGVDRFEGEHIHFGEKGFENWDKVVEYLLKKENFV